MFSLMLSLWLASPCTSATIELQTSPYIILERNGKDVRRTIPEGLRSKLVVESVHRGAVDGESPWRIKFGDGPFMEVFGDSFVDNEKGIIWDLRLGVVQEISALSVVK